MIHSQVSYYKTRCKLLEIKNNEMKDDMENLENQIALKQGNWTLNFPAT